MADNEINVSNDSRSQKAGFGRAKWMPSTNKKGLLIALSVAGILSLLLIGSVMVFRAQDTKKSSVRTQIEHAQNTGDYSQAAELIKKSIDKATSKTQKSSLYIDLGNTYLDANNTDEAVRAYNSAATANGMTYTVARMLASIYLEKGDEQRAITYYHKAIELWPKSDPLYNAEVNSIRQTIDDLQKEPSQ